MEIPGPVKFDTPSPAGMIQFGQHLFRAQPEAAPPADAPTQLWLKSEDDIRRLGNGRLLISTAQGLQFGIARASELDRHSRKLLERFL